ncbi:MAG: hypothetical protein IPK79_06280 [Vampirovibrionales bacterium]|nr:hypothetical protein [Vampirovibrionales bacterium]
MGNGTSNARQLGIDTARGFLELQRLQSHNPAMAYQKNEEFSYSAPIPQQGKWDETIANLKAYGSGYAEEIKKSGLPSDFSRYDFDHNGHVSPIEVGLGVACLDLNQDGRVTPQERLEQASDLTARGTNPLEQYIMKVFGASGFDGGLKLRAAFLDGPDVRQ